MIKLTAPTSCRKLQKLGVLVPLMFAIALAVLIIYSRWTFPGYPFYNYDSSVFFTIGWGMTEGVLPYRDLFDHKGPLLYIIYALGWLISPGKAGLFSIQTINLTLYLCFVWMFLISKVTRPQALLFLFSVVFCISGLFSGGGLTEEFSLVPGALAMYFVRQPFSGDKRGISFAPFVWVMLGICLSIPLFLRVNNVCTVAGLLVGLGLALLWKKAYVSLINAVLFSFLGLILGALPIVLWLNFYEILDECYDVYILFNLSYACVSDAHGQTILDFASKAFQPYFWPLFLFYVISIVTLCSQNAAKYDAWLGLIVSITTHLFFIIGSASFKHYYIMVAAIIPLYAMPAVQLARRIHSRGVFIAVIVLCLLSFSSYIQSSIRVVLSRMVETLFVPDSVAEKTLDKFANHHAILEKAAQDLEKRIHEDYLRMDIAKRFSEMADENDWVLCINTFPDIHLYAHCLPRFRYFTVQDVIQVHGRDSYEKITELLSGSCPPRFLLLSESKHSLYNGGDIPASLRSTILSMYKPLTQKATAEIKKVDQANAVLYVLK